MAGTQPKSNIESFSSEKVNEMVKISSLSQLKEALGVNSLAGIDEEFRESFITSKTELLKIKEELTRDETSLKLRELLEDKGVIGEIGEKFHRATESFREKYAGKEASEKMKNGSKELLKDIEGVGKKAINSKVVQEGAKKAKEVAAKGKDAVAGLGFIGGLEKMAEKGGLMGGIASFLLMILGIFGFGKKVEDVSKEVKEKLSPENIKQTKNKVNEYITNNFGDTLTPENKEQLEKSLDDLTQEQVLELSKKLKSGKLTFTDITAIVPNIVEKFLKKEQIEKLKFEAKEKIISSIKKEVAAKYSVTVEGDKLEDLEKLVKENTTISDETIGKFIDINKEQQILFSDLFGPSFEAIINSTSLFFGLLIKGIVPIGAFGLDFAEASTDVIKLSAHSLGVTKAINIDTFNKSIEKLGPDEKAILVGLLYRKGGLLLNIVGSMSETVARLGTEFLTNTPVKTYDLMSASFSNNYPKQIKNLEKITSAIGVENYKDVGSILVEATDNLKTITNNYKILEIIKNSDGKTSTVIEMFKIHNINIGTLNKDLPFDKFVSSLKDKISVRTEQLSNRSAASALGFGANADLFKLNKRLEQVSKAQRAMFDGNILTKGLLKIKEISNIGEVSRLGDRLVLHFESVDAAKKGISKWNTLANKFPDLVKGTLDKLPIIAVAGIAANSDKPFFEEFTKQMQYLFPVVGPILLISDSGISWKEGKIESINAIEAGIGGALLTLDGVFLSKELAKGGLRAGLSYTIKPIKDIYSIGKGVSEGAWSIGKAAVNGKSFSGIIKESVTKSKFIKSTKLKAVAIAAGIIYFGAGAAFADNELDEIFGEDGTMNKEKLKENIADLNNNEKISCLQYLIAESHGNDSLNGINLSISNGELKIESNNDNYQGDWILGDNSMIDLLQINYKGDFKYIPETKKPA